MKYKKQYGFTFIELMVTMSIMAVLTLSVIVQYRSADRTRRTQLASDIVLSALRDGQNAALSGKKATDCGGDDNPYVVRFTYSSPTITLGCKTSTFQKYSLPAGTNIKPVGMLVLNNDGSTTPASGNGMLMYFYPPFGTVKACPVVDTAVENCLGSIISFTNTTINVQSSTDISLVYTVTADGLSGKIDSSRQ